MFTSVQKMNDSVVQLKVQVSETERSNVCANDTHFLSFKLFLFCFCLWDSSAG